MRRILAAFAVGAGLLGASTMAMAQTDGRMYAGVGFGQASVDGFCDVVRDEFAVFGGTVASCDEKDTAFKVFLGYRVNPNFAIEGSYFSYGEASAAGTLVGVPVRATGDATAFGVAALGILPLGNRFSLFGKVGILMTDFKFTVAGGGFSTSASEDETGLHYGFGAMFDITPNFGIRAEWERNDELEADMMSLGLQVRF